MANNQTKGGNVIGLGYTKLECTCFYTSSNHQTVYFYNTYGDMYGCNTKEALKVYWGSITFMVGEYNNSSKGI
jgi:hypothetical protein